jgi:ubiquinone/menaquinone biosynthesis C-methylase UbiE
MVLQLIDHPLKMLSECYRVLKPGGMCAFTVWGRKSHMVNMSILEKARLKLGREITKEISNFDAGESISDTVKYMTDLGFKYV